MLVGQYTTIGAEFGQTCNEIRGGIVTNCNKDADGSLVVRLDVRFTCGIVLKCDGVDKRRARNFGNTRLVPNGNVGLGRESIDHSTGCTEHITANDDLYLISKIR